MSYEKEITRIKSIVEEYLRNAELKNGLDRYRELIDKSHLIFRTELNNAIIRLQFQLSGINKNYLNGVIQKKEYQLQENVILDHLLVSFT